MCTIFVRLYTNFNNWFEACMLYLVLLAHSGNVRQMLQNPEMMQEVMNSPIMQSLTSNPEIMRSIMMSNPEMQQLMEVKY